MNDKPLISIIIPVYNAEQYLAKCLDSVIGQTYQKLEIICINDGSEDASLNILREFAKKDLRIHILDKANAGVSQARNDGLKVARGEFVLFLDADDWIDRETCEKAVAAMHDYHVDVVMWSYVSETAGRSSKKYIFPETRVFDETEVKNLLHRRFVGAIGEELSAPELVDALCPVWGKLYKREVIEKSKACFIDLSEIGTYEDGFFNLEVFGEVNRAVYISEFFNHYRRDTTSSVTSGYRPHLFNQWQRLYDRMDKYIQNRQLNDLYKKALNNRIALGILGLGLNITCSSCGIWKKVHMLHDILSFDRYRIAYRNLDYNYFPIHWRVFYGCARLRLSLSVYVLLCAIQSIITK